MPENKHNDSRPEPRLKDSAHLTMSEMLSNLHHSIEDVGSAIVTSPREKRAQSSTSQGQAPSHPEP